MGSGGMVASMLRAAPLVSILLCVGLPSTKALASDADPWLGRDKMLHFGVSAALASGGYAAGALLGGTTTERLLAGAGLSLTLGVAKELYDLAGHGDPSWRDLSWDVIGTGAGLALAYGVDRLLGCGAEGRVAVARGGLALRW